MAPQKPAGRSGAGPPGSLAMSDLPSEHSSRYKNSSESLNAKLAFCPNLPSRQSGFNDPHISNFLVYEKKTYIFTSIRDSLLKKSFNDLLLLFLMRKTGLFMPHFRLFFSYIIFHINAHFPLLSGRKFNFCGNVMCV